MIKCTVVHGSRIGVRAKGYGIGIAADGPQCIIERLIKVKYLHEMHIDESPRGVLAERYDTLKLGDRIVEVDGAIVSTHDECHKEIKKGGELLELTVMRDPTPDEDGHVGLPEPLMRDRLWNYSATLYVLAVATMVVLFICFTGLVLVGIDKMELARQAREGAGSDDLVDPFYLKRGKGKLEL